jgi:RNA polymerase sigma factor (TIGR02999 family)
LSAWAGGDPSALDALVPLVYAELRRLAHHYKRGERRGFGLETTALVHEAYLRLVKARDVRFDNRVHFYAVCAGIIRRILVDIARQEHALKRGGEAPMVVFDEAHVASPQPTREVIAVDEALVALAADDPRKARIVELRYFGGLTVDETAEVLGFSRATVLREWNLAKQWLFHELGGETPRPAGAGRP